MSANSPTTYSDWSSLTSVCVSCELSVLRLAAAKMSCDVGRRFLMSCHLCVNLVLQRGRWRDLQPVRVRGRGLQRAGRQEADEADPGGSGLPPPEQCGPSGPEGQSVGMNMLRISSLAKFFLLESGLIDALVSSPDSRRTSC